MGSSPAFFLDQIPSVEQWDQYFSTKMDEASSVVVVPTNATTVVAGDLLGGFILNPASPLSSLTVEAPASPQDFQRFWIATTQDITAVTVTAANGQTLNNGGPFALGAGAAMMWQYLHAWNTWYSFQSTAATPVITYPYGLGAPTGYQQITNSGTAGGLVVPTGSSSAVLAVSRNAIRIRFDGTDPTATVGFPVSVGETYTAAGGLSMLRLISQTGTAVVDVLYFKPYYQPTQIPLLYSTLPMLVSAPGEGDTVAVGSGTGLLVLQPMSALNVVDVVVPTDPVDRQEFRISTTQDIEALTVASSDKTLSGGGPWVASPYGGMAWVYSAAYSTWFKVQ